MNTELNSIKGKKVLVIGDVMLDTYHIDRKSTRLNSSHPK